MNEDLMMNANYYNPIETWKQELEHRGYKHYYYSVEDLQHFAIKPATE